jgi:hypothetical protein
MKQDQAEIKTKMCCNSTEAKIQQNLQENSRRSIWTKKKQIRSGHHHKKSMNEKGMNWISIPARKIFVLCMRQVSINYSWRSCKISKGSNSFRLPKIWMKSFMVSFMTYFLLLLSISDVHPFKEELFKTGTHSATSTFNHYWRIF